MTDYCEETIIMKLYFVAVIVSLGSMLLIIQACMFHDSPTRHAPVYIAYLR